MRFSEMDQLILVRFGLTVQLGSSLFCPPLAIKVGLKTKTLNLTKKIEPLLTILELNWNNFVRFSSIQFGPKQFSLVGTMQFGFKRSKIIWFFLVFYIFSMVPIITILFGLKQFGSVQNCSIRNANSSVQFSFFF